MFQIQDKIINQIINLVSKSKPGYHQQVHLQQLHNQPRYKP
jgi:hypothetical protein